MIQTHGECVSRFIEKEAEELNDLQHDMPAAANWIVRYRGGGVRELGGAEIMMGSMV